MKIKIKMKEKKIKTNRQVRQKVTKIQNHPEVLRIQKVEVIPHLRLRAVVQVSIGVGIQKILRKKN